MLRRAGAGSGLALPEVSVAALAARAEGWAAAGAGRASLRGQQDVAGVRCGVHRQPPLTGRELEILRMMAAGRSNQSIAGELVVTLDTVKKHVGHVLGKLGAANRTEAVARARELSLIP